MEGKRVAGETGFSRYADGLRSAARRLTSSDAEAEDLVQECLAAAVEGAGRVRNTELLGAWLHQILRRKWYDLLRRRALERRHRAEGPPTAMTVEAGSAGGELASPAVPGLDPDARASP